MMLTATGHWIDVQEVPIYIYIYLFLIKLSRLARHLEVTPITLTSEKNEKLKKQKGTQREEKQTK